MPPPRRALRDTTASRLAAIVESSDDAIVGKDLNGLIETWNRGAERLFGYQAEDIVGTSILRLIPDDRHEEEHRILDQIRRGESVRHFETVRRTKAGALIDVSVTASPIRDGSGRIVGVSKVARDISERKRGEAAMRASEGRYRALFDYAPDGIIIADPQAYYLDANASICQMLGYTRDELVGRHASDFLVPAEVADIAPALELLKTTRDYRRPRTFRRKDGSTFAADVIATTLPGGNLLGMIRDLTDRNEASAALSTAEERMRFALENAQVGIWDADYVTGAVTWSRTIEAQHGLAPGTFGGTFDAFVSLVHEDDRQGLLDAVGLALTSGEDFTTQYRTTRPDGSVRWMTGSGRVLLGPDGRPLRGVGISLDVTDRRALEAQYQQAQKMEAIGRLAGGVAHDFNNLLGVILGYSQLLLRGLPAADPHRADIVEIEKAAASAAALTRQLLAFSRKEIIEPRLLDLNSVLSEMREMLERLIGEDVKVIFTLRPDLASVKADRGQIEQVLMNLVVNARDAMPDGGIVTIETATVNLDAAYARTHLSLQPGPYVALTVSDTGHGMTADVQAHLFEPFFTTKERGKGTGLGLATVHGIVTQSGGRVNVYSEIGRGTSFRIYLPASGSGPVPVQTPPDHRPAAQALTVLVVEDAPGLRELARRFLEELGHTVVLAEHAEQAMHLFRTEAIDVLLTDVVMPGISGPELVQRLRTERPTLKVVYMSGYTEDAIVQRGVLAPGVVFLHKPFTIEALSHKLHDALDR